MNHSRKRLNYVHHIPGRLRVRSAEIRGNERGAQAAKAAIGSLPGVKSVEANPLTGSITVLYDPKATDAEAVLGSLRHHGYTAHARIPERAVARRLSSANPQIGAIIAKRVTSYVVEAALERSILALVTAIL